MTHDDLKAIEDRALPVDVALLAEEIRALWVERDGLRSALAAALSAATCDNCHEPAVHWERHVGTDNLEPCCGNQGCCNLIGRWSESWRLVGAP